MEKLSYEFDKEGHTVVIVEKKQHSSEQPKELPFNEQDAKVIEDNRFNPDIILKVINGIRTRPYPAPVKFSSEDLILLAHDEWKRREERKHNHPEQCWVAGYLNGFCTSKRWAREYVDKLRSKK